MAEILKKLKKAGKLTDEMLLQALKLGWINKTQEEEISKI